MLRKLGLLCLVLTLCACGGGGGGGGSSTTTSGGGSSTTPAPPAALTNTVAITVDGGPASLATGPNAYEDYNSLFVTVTICAPGTTNCQTIDHVQVDTGSIGLRIFASVLNPTLLAALPLESDTSSNPVGECYGFVSGYTFGSVRQGDFQVGGESVADMPLQVIGDSGAFATAPSSCSSGGGTSYNGVSSFGANGVIGIGTTSTDCGNFCTVAGGSAAATYYDCPSSGCGAVIARAASTTAPFQQLPNPVAAMAVDNNGTIISLPAVPSGGSATLSGTLYFGIGTESNNALNSATVLTATSSTSAGGPGLVTAVYKGQSLPDSFIDSGSNLYLFVDSTIIQCTQKDFTGYYCPSSPLSLSPTIQGLNGASASAAFTLYNAETELSTTSSSTAVPGVGGDPSSLSIMNAYPTSFDFALPFFFGRNIYTAIEGRNAGGTVGPYFAY